MRFSFCFINEDSPCGVHKCAKTPPATMRPQANLLSWLLKQTKYDFKTRDVTGDQQTRSLSVISSLLMSSLFCLFRHFINRFFPSSLLSHTPLPLLANVAPVCGGGTKKQKFPHWSKSASPQKKSEMNGRVENTQKAPFRRTAQR